MWMALEDGRLLNTDMITDIVFHRDHEEKAVAMGYGLVLSGDSPMVYRHFKPIYDQAVLDQAPKVVADVPPQTDAPLQVGQE